MKAKSLTGRQNAPDTLARISLADPDLGALASEVLERLEAASGERDMIKRLLRGLGTELDRTRRVAEAVAAANVDAVVIAQSQADLAEELRRERADLEHRSRLLEADIERVQAEARALADANVDAVLMADELESTLASSLRETESLARERDEHRQRAEWLLDEARMLSEANRRAIDRLGDREDALRAAQGRAEELAHVNDELVDEVTRDRLTGLLSRQEVERRLRAAVRSASRDARPLSIAFIDVDSFKFYNDHHGHIAGDVALRLVGGVIRSSLRGADALGARAPAAGRFGGEEFVVVLPGTDLAGGIVAAERIRTAIGEHAFPFGHAQPGGRLTVSIGVARLGPGEGAIELLDRADTALYQSKASGRDRTTAAAPAPRAPARD